MIIMVLSTEILAASVRHTMHVIDCAKLGADVMTGPLSSITGLLKASFNGYGIREVSCRLPKR